MSDVEIYTDGACRGNPGPGGWGAVLRANGHEKHLHGGERNTTNNRMELTAAIIALEALKRPCSVTLYTDSQYLRQGISEWMPRWIQRRWRTANKKPVKNADLWIRLASAAAAHKINWQWVKAHTGIEGNELADQLANLAIDQEKFE